MPSRSLILIAALAAALAAGYGGGRLAGQARAAAPAAPVELPDFGPIVNRYGPAVVNITTVSDRRGPVRAAPDPDDPLYDFLRRFGLPVPQGGGPQRGLGSGFIVSPDGLVLTNAHVVADASEVVVKLTDKREFRARVLGLDQATDVAVLRIDARGLPTVRLGTATPVRVGEWVLAIGAPFGFENSVTAGIVSARSRALPDESYVPFIQTDVAVNPGNSGGPLFNLRGEVIGLNSQIYSRSGGYQGLSFAIPIDVAMKAETEILRHGRVTRGRLGVAIQELDPPLAESFGLKRPAGALVSAVEPGSPAERAGLRPGDVILAVNGAAVESSADLPPKVAELKPGAVAVLDVWRGGRAQRLGVTVGTFEEAGPTVDRPAGDRGRLGLRLRPLTAAERREAQVGAGLLVLEAAGPAARAGIQPGDVILAVNGTPVEGAERLRALAAKAGRHVALLVLRDGARMFVPLGLE